ncbi:Two component transcriptional regulator, LuxR family [Candidatus Sulfotelmatobacter kueseliae]|uniref:Two component transcriptional regulator, LuxR family n=1 Tax=Candidatus Sulfotelmatobacter kueseliae TaxID=2042962 RepID=A0A2U3L6L7_9BACT|nr:Two component transcriptional regulator, LuxR family [Candidatus Sulfotelmatobacter kueseliae]
MATIPVSVDENPGAGEDGGKGHFIRVIVADTQAIFRAGLRKVFALEDDIRVVGQAETLAQTQSAVKKFSSDVVIFEAALAPNPVEAVADLIRQNPQMRIVVVTPGADEELTLELFRRGTHGIVSREVEPELLVDCLRQVAAGETWLENKAVHWVMEAYRNQNNRPAGARPKVQLTPKETLIVSCVTQGMKNKEIALRVGTTEQVVKNYLRKVYDKLGVADRLELALYCLNHHVVDNTKVPPLPTSAVNGNAKAAAAGAGASTSSSVSNSTPDPAANSPEKHS